MPATAREDSPVPTPTPPTENASAPPPPRRSPALGCSSGHGGDSDSRTDCRTLCASAPRRRKSPVPPAAVDVEGGAHGGRAAQRASCAARGQHRASDVAGTAGVRAAGRLSRASLCVVRRPAGGAVVAVRNGVAARLSDGAGEYGRRRGQRGRACVEGSVCRDEGDPTVDVEARAPPAGGGERIREAWVSVARGALFCSRTECRAALQAVPERRTCVRGLGAEGSTVDSPPWRPFGTVCGLVPCRRAHRLLSNLRDRGRAARWWGPGDKESRVQRQARARIRPQAKGRAGQRVGHTPPRAHPRRRCCHHS